MSLDSFGFYCEGNRVQYSKPEEEKHLIMSYEEIVSKHLEGFPVDPLKESSVFAGWINTYEDGQDYGNEIQLVPMIVNYDTNVKPKVQYDEVEHVFEVEPEAIPDNAVMHGITTQKINQDMIKNSDFYCRFIIDHVAHYKEPDIKVCSITLPAPTSIYTLSDLNNAKRNASQKIDVQKIENVKVGDMIPLEVESIQLTDNLSDLRYVPSKWTVKELNLSGTFEANKGKTKSVSDVYTSQIQATKAGEYPVDISWKGQVLQNGEWVDLDSHKDYAEIVKSVNYKAIESAPDITQPEEPVQPEKPVEPDKPIVNSDDSIKSEVNQEKPIDNQLVSQQNNNQKNIQDNKPLTQDETSLGLATILCAGSLLIISVLVVVKRKVS